MVAEPERYIHRRVETVEFLDERLLRRRLSVDFSVPEIAGGANPGAAESVWLPVTVMRKSLLRSFDLRDEAGRALPLLTATQTADLSDLILRVVAFDALATKPVSRSLAEDISGLCKPNAADALPALRRFRGAHSRDHAQVWADADFKMLATDISANFFLFVPTSYDPTARRIVKVAWIEDYRSTGLVFFGRLGLSAARAQFDAPAVGFAASSHIEIRVPPALALAKCQQVATEVQKGKRVLGEPRTEDRTSLAVGHLYCAGLPRGSHDRVVLGLRIRLEGFLYQAFLVCLFITSMLWAGLVLERRGASYRPDGTAAVIVVLPGIVAGYLAGPGEHGLLKRLASLVRALITIQALVAFAAAALLALVITPGLRPMLWRILAEVSLVPTMTLALASLLSWVNGAQRGSKG